MKSKFKVGDRVKWTKYGGSSWQNCTITDISPRFDGHMGYMLTDPHPEFGDGWIAENELELVAPTPESKALSLLRKIVDHGGYGAIGVEAKAILEGLEPVDADLVEARLICKGYDLKIGCDEYFTESHYGNADESNPSVAIALAAITLATGKDA